MVSLCYQFGYLSHKQSGVSPKPTDSSVEVPIGASPQPTSSSGEISAGTPAVWATLSFSNASGFVTTIHPTNGTIEFVLSPSSTGEFTVTYTGIGNNNLTIPAFNPVENPVNAMNVNITNGTLGTGSELSVAESNVTWVSDYQVVVNYSVTSGGSNGLYVLGLPDTFLSTIVEIGTQPYTGPLTWLNGTFS